VDQVDPVDEVESSARARRPHATAGSSKHLGFWGIDMPFAAEIPKKKKPNYFDNYSGFADF
jgi:hypothetical protein